MTEKKTEKREVSKRAITILLLLSMLIFSLGAFSYAWYQNYVDIKGPSLTTGKISLQIDGYGVDAHMNVTPITPITINGQTESSVVVNSTVTEIDTWNKEYHVYYFIKNPDTDTSIDLDASISISLDNAVIDNKLGGITVDINQIRTEAMTGKLSDIDGLSQEQMIAAVKQGAADIEPEADGISFSNLDGAYKEISVPTGEYACVRITYQMPNNLADYSDMDLSVRVSFCFAQKDGLPGATTYSEYIVYNLEGLKTVISKYRPNDKIVIKGDIEYSGDLIINRPIVLEIQNAKLDVKGNILYAYPYQGRFTVDTSRGGSIAVFKRNEEQFDEDGNLEGVIEIGGNFEINTPLSQIEFIGKNSANILYSDIYVEGTLRVSASNSAKESIYKQGFIVNGSNIRPVKEERGDQTGYKEILLGDHTRINIASYTTVGNIRSTSPVIEIENRGTVYGVDLSLMAYDSGYSRTLPQIYINNYGSFINPGISLPINWAEKFVSDSNGTVGNTRIISQPGSGAMYVDPATNGFISDGSRDPARDHIEYVKLSTYVEKVNGSSSNIVVQYINDTGLYLKGTETDIGSSLETLLEYYMGNIGATEVSNSNEATNVNSSLMIAQKDHLQSVKIVCYSAFLSSADYEYIRSMSGLITLDLSGAASSENKVPDGAFKNMSKLSSVQMSRHDITWGRELFVGTKVDEIRLPDSLVNTTTTTFNNIKYIHTASRSVANVQNSTRLVFVPDATTFAAYNTSNYYGKVFYDADRYAMDTGDYFLRLDSDTKTAEFVAFMSSQYSNSYFDTYAESIGEAQFDFNTITVNNVKYAIKVYDTYSFYNKTFRNVTGGELNIGLNTESIEAYAFGSVKGFNILNFKGTPRLEENSFRSITLNTINITGDSYIGNNAFRGSTAVYLNAPSVKETGSYSFADMKYLVEAYLPSLRVTNEPFYNTANIFRLDIGIFREGTKFGNSSYNTKYTFIHTDSTDNADDYEYTLRYTGITDSNFGSRVVFVPADFAKVFVNYGTEITLSSGVSIENIKEYFDPDDENIIGTTKQPSLYYIDNLDGTASILRYLNATPKAATDIFAVKDENGNSYAVTELMEYSYTGITIKRDELVFAPTIEKVQAYAFSGSNKTIGYLDLNNVEYIGRRAFQNNVTAVAKGPKVETIGDYAFYNNDSLIMIEFPSFRYGEKTETYGACFYECNNLKIAFMGPMDYSVRDYIFWSCTSLQLVIIDATDRTGTKYPSDPFWTDSTPIVLVVGDSSVKNESYVANRGLSRRVNADLSNLFIRGETEYSITVNNKVYSVTVPESIYMLKNDGNAELLKMSKAKVDQERYTLPTRIVPTDNKVSWLNFSVPEIRESYDVNDGGYKLTSIANRAFRGVDFGETIFNTGHYMTTINSGSLGGLNAKYLELENVTEVGTTAFLGSKIQSVVANKLEIIGYEAFQDCKNLKEIYLPAIVTMKSWSFWGSGIESITLGENLTTIGAGEFADCPNLKEVIFLSPHRGFPDTIFYDYIRYPGNYMGTKEENIQIVVKSEYRAPYDAQWTGKIGSIGVFENSYTDHDTNLTYFYSVVSGNNVELAFFRASVTYEMGSIYTFPSQFVYVDENSVEHTYTVTHISDMMFNQIGNQPKVETVILPSGLEDLSQNMESLPSNVRTFVIADENSYYQTDDGVIYSDGGNVLLFYPRAKQTAEFTIPSTVTLVAEGAFAGNEFIREVNIDHKVSFANRTFYSCVILQSVNITSAEPCLFLGTDNFTLCYPELEITVPTGTSAQHKAGILFDFYAQGLITEATQNP